MSWVCDLRNYHFDVVCLLCKLWYLLDVIGLGVVVVYVLASSSFCWTSVEFFLLLYICVLAYAFALLCCLLRSSTASHEGRERVVRPMASSASAVPSWTEANLRGRLQLDVLGCKSVVTNLVTGERLTLAAGSWELVYSKGCSHSSSRSGFWGDSARLVAVVSVVVASVVLVQWLPFLVIFNRFVTVAPVVIFSCYCYSCPRL